MTPGDKVIAGLYRKSSDVPVFTLSDPLEVAGVSTQRPRIYLNRRKAEELGVVNLFTAGAKQRAFYVDAASGGFVPLKTRAFCAQAGHAHYGCELRFALRA